MRATAKVWLRMAIALVMWGATAGWAAPGVMAAEQWIEVKSAHFVVTSNAGQDSARTLAWQLEQIRGAIAALWPWAKVDLNTPLAVVALKDENSMKALAPAYWERKGGVHPSSVWVGGADQQYLAIRTDVSANDKLNINPYVTSYFSYASLILGQSFEHELPLWFSRGLAGVLSNTIVRDAKLLIGPPIPWHLQRLRDVQRLRLPALIATRGSSPDFMTDEGQRTFDAESWAFVHFLMFGEAGARWPKFDQFAKLVAARTDPDTAFREALGRPEDLETPFYNYISRNLFSFTQANIDVSVKPEGFTVRPLSPADAASRRALFHAAMNRPAEAHAAIEEARKADASSPESFVAEALLLDRDGKNDEAKTAFARAVEAGTTSAYAHYRLASLLWRSDADRGALTRLEQLLNSAITLNNRDADAYAFLGEVRSLLGTGEPLSLVLRAISLEPFEARHHLRAAGVLWRDRKYDEALKQAEAALRLAKDEESRRRAREMVDVITRAQRGAV
jgi:tetratricopeptide (TPR) repeat protein